MKKIERINELIEDGIDDASKLNAINDIVLKLTPGNKLNFLLYDGDYLYVHKNEPGTMFRKALSDAVIVSTHPLDDSVWEDVPQNQLLVYRDGKLVYEGTRHENTYYHDEAKFRYQYLDHATL